MSPRRQARSRSPGSGLVVGSVGRRRDVRVPAPTVVVSAGVAARCMVRLHGLAPAASRRPGDVSDAPAHRHHEPAGQRAAGGRLPHRQAARGRLRRHRARVGADPRQPGHALPRRRQGGAAPAVGAPRRGRGRRVEVEAAAVLRRHRRRLPVGPRRHRHEEHGRDVGRHHAQAGRRQAGARARRHLRRRRRRGGRLRPGLAVPRRATPRAGARRVRHRRVRRLLAPPRRHHAIIRSRSPRRACAGCAPASPASPATARCPAATAPSSRWPRPSATSARPRCRCTPPATSRTSSAAVAARQPRAAQPLLRLLTRPELLSRVLRLIPDLGTTRSLGALLSNTASPTVVRAGNKTNVIPGIAEVEIDGRTLPGQTEEDFLARAAHRPRPRRRARGHPLRPRHRHRARRVRRCTTSSPARSSPASPTASSSPT